MFTNDVTVGQRSFYLHTFLILRDWPLGYRAYTYCEMTSWAVVKSHKRSLLFWLPTCLALISPLRSILLSSPMFPLAKKLGEGEGVQGTNVIEAASAITLCRKYVVVERCKCGVCRMKMVPSWSTVIPATSVLSWTFFAMASWSSKIILHWKVFVVWSFATVLQSFV